MVVQKLLVKTASGTLIALMLLATAPTGAQAAVGGEETSSESLATCPDVQANLNRIYVCIMNGIWSGEPCDVEVVRQGLNINHEYRDDCIHNAPTNPIPLILHCPGLVVVVNPDLGRYVFEFYAICIEDEGGQTHYYCGFGVARDGGSTTFSEDVEGCKEVG